MHQDSSLLLIQTVSQSWLLLRIRVASFQRWIFQTVCLHLKKPGVKIMESRNQDVMFATATIKILLLCSLKTQLDLDVQSHKFQLKIMLELQWISESTFTLVLQVQIWVKSNKTNNMNRIAKNSSITLDQTDSKSFCLKKLKNKSDLSLHK
jgi:hypothetical protein